MALLSMNGSMGSVNTVIRVVLKKLAGWECGRLPGAEVRHILLVETKYIANVQVRKAMLENSDVQSLVGNTVHRDGTSKHHRHHQNFQITTTAGKSLSLGLIEMGKSDASETISTPEAKIMEVKFCVAQREMHPR